MIVLDILLSFFVGLVFIMAAIAVFLIVGRLLIFPLIAWIEGWKLPWERRRGHW